MAAALVAAVLWALTGLFVRGLDAVPLGALVWSRFAVSFLLLAPMALAGMGQGDAAGRRGAEADPASSAEEKRGSGLWWRDVGLSSCMTAYYIFATAGFALGPVALTSLVIALTPAVTLAWQLAAGRRIRRREVFGFAVAAAGVALYFGPLLSGTPGFGAAAILAATGAAVVATVVRAGYTILLWRRAERSVPVRSARLNRLTFAVGAVVLTPVFAASAPHTLWSAHAVVLLLVLVVVSTIVPNLLSTWASARIEPTANAIIGMLTPPVAGVLGWVVLDEVLTVVQMAGMALTLVGVGVATLGRVRVR